MTWVSTTQIIKIDISIRSVCDNLLQSSTHQTYKKKLIKHVCLNGNGVQSLTFTAFLLVIESENLMISPALGQVIPLEQHSTNGII